jgi:uncharacterized protein (DUF2267 family)
MERRREASRQVLGRRPRAVLPTSWRVASEVTAVFTLLANRISEGEIEDAKQVLPSELRERWP